MSFYLMWRESTRQSLLFFLSPADVANLAHLSPWTNLFRVLSGQARPMGLKRLHSIVWPQICGWSQVSGRSQVYFCSALKRISDMEPRDAAVWCGEFAHAQRRLWKPKSVSGVERFHFSAASAVGQHHVIQLASDWLHLSF